MKTAVVIWILFVQGTSGTAINQIGIYPNKAQCETDAKLIKKSFYAHTLCLEKTRK